jgi:hypothetical protein
VTWACLGRLLIGGCVAVAYVVSLKLAVNWFPASYFSMISGLGLLAGILGAVTAGVPLRLLVDAFGWRPVMMAAAACTGLLAAATWVLVRDDPGERGYQSYARSGAKLDTPMHAKGFAGVAEVFRCVNTWLLFFIPASLVGSVLTFCGLWGVPYLATHYGLSTAQAARTLSFAADDLMGRSEPLLAGCRTRRWAGASSDDLFGHFMAGVGWSILLLTPGLPLCWPAHRSHGGYWRLLGELHRLLVLAKRIGSPWHLSGTISGRHQHGGIMLGVTVLPARRRLGARSPLGGCRPRGGLAYSGYAYQAGFELTLGWILLSLLLLFFTRETYGRQMP